MCIGTGGSVGREGPIVQIGSGAGIEPWASGSGSPESRMRILVACGAGGGIAATFNAPVTGVFFGFEVILREVSAGGAVPGDAVSHGRRRRRQALLGGGRFLSRIPAGIALHHLRDYLLVAALAVVAALLGIGLQTALYRTEDLCDRIWNDRPEWARPAAGGVTLGLLLLALPQMYGVGYPVMYRAVAGHYAVWFLMVLAAGKVIAASLTIGIGGSGGVFAPSLFIGATSGMAFGEIAGHLLGRGAGHPAPVRGRGDGRRVCRGHPRAADLAGERGGDDRRLQPHLAGHARRCHRYRGLQRLELRHWLHPKLLRRGTDIDRPPPWQVVDGLTVSDAMWPLAVQLDVTTGPASGVGRVQAAGSLAWTRQGSRAG